MLRLLIYKRKTNNLNIGFRIEGGTFLIMVSEEIWSPPRMNISKPVMVIIFILNSAYLTYYHVLVSEGLYSSRKNTKPRNAQNLIINSPEGRIKAPDYTGNLIINLSAITSESALSMYNNQIKKMDRGNLRPRFYKVRTLNAGPVSYDISDEWPRKSISGVPDWELNTFEEFDHWLPKSKYYVGFGTWIGPTLFYGTQLVKKAVGFEGDPVAYAKVYTNLQWNKHRDWYYHTHVYPVAVKQGKEKKIAERERVTMHSALAGNSCSGLKDVACGNVTVSWEIDAYTLPYLLQLTGIPVSNETFIKIDVEGYECELIPSWFDWLKNYSDKPTMRVSFHAHSPCSDEQYKNIFAFSKLYKTTWNNMTKTSIEEILDLDTKKSPDVVFSDLLS